MSRIPEETIQAIRDRVDIVDLVGRYLTLRKCGRNWKGLCPFHEEKTPSFSVNPDRQVFHCFGCGAGGNAVGFLMRRENLTFPEALRSLARECGIEVPEARPGERREMEGLAAALELAQRLYGQALRGSEGGAARAYLGERGLDGASAARFGLGFAPERWDYVARALAAEGIPAGVGEKAGLLAERRSGGFYDRLRERITFPIRDARGRILGFGGRALRSDQEPKYLNTPESPLFRKREALYGLPEALETIRRRERAVVVEGYFDRIALHRAGVEEALATCGTALTPDHARSLRRRTREVVLLFDGDEAGQRAIGRALEALLPAGLRVRAALLPAGEDPDSVLVREGPGRLRALVEEAPAALDAVIQRALAQGSATPFEKSDAVAAVAPLLAQIPDRIERREVSRRLALAAGVDLRDVEATARDAEREEPGEGPRLVGVSPEERFARRIGRLLLAFPALGPRLEPAELAELVAEPVWGSVLSALAGACASGGPVDVAALAEPLEETARGILFALACEEEPLADPAEAARILEDTLARLRERRHAEERRALTQRIAGETGAQARELLGAKQRQLEERRKLRGLAPASPTPEGVPGILR